MEKRHTIFKIVPPICDHGNWRLIFWKAVYWLSILYCHPLGPRNFLSKRVCSVSLSACWPGADKNLERGQGPIHWGECLNKYRSPHNCLDCWKKWIYYSWVKKPIKEVPTPKGEIKEKHLSHPRRLSVTSKEDLMMPAQGTQSWWSWCSFYFY